MDLPSASSQGADEFVGSKRVIKKVELVRVITEALYSLGYEKTVKVLEKDLGPQLLAKEVELFVMDGRWDGLLEIFRDITSIEECRFEEISSLILNQKRAEEKWEKVSYILKRRENIFDDLKMLNPPSVMVPEKRLIELVEQALDFQRDSCIFHNIEVHEMSLINDHLCGTDVIPSIALETLEGSWGEILFLQFSHNGKYLAASTKDCFVIIWKVLESGRFSVPSKLEGHTKPVTYIAWSPDDLQLLTCGAEEIVKRWNIPPTGEFSCLDTHRKRDSGTVSCAWSLDMEFVVAGLNNRYMSTWNISGGEEMCDMWQDKLTRNADLASTHDGKDFVTVCGENMIMFVSSNWQFPKFIKEDGAIVSFSLSKDRKFLLVSTSNEEIHLWDIEISCHPVMVMKYEGHRRRSSTVRACVGGMNQGFIASGSEDSMVYIWNRASGKLILTLEGHSAVVNCVSWNPANPHMLASASDDRTVRIWGNAHI